MNDETDSEFVEFCVVILNSIVEKLKHQSKSNSKGRQFEAWLIVQAVAWYQRYPLSYRDLEEMFLELGFEVDYRTVKRWVLAYAPMTEKGLRGFLLIAKRDLGTAKRFFKKMLKDEPLLAPRKIGTGDANTFPSTIKTAVDEGLPHPAPLHYVTKHLPHGIENDHFRVKKNMQKVGGFQTFNTARPTIAGFESMLWLRKGFGISRNRNVNKQYELLGHLIGLQWVNEP